MRADLLQNISDQTRSAVTHAPSGQSKLLVISCSQDPADWKALGIFMARLRQFRRKHRAQFYMKTKRLSSESFASKQEQWRNNGHFVCRHGVFFTRPQLRVCPCMETGARSDDARWQYARFMPWLDHDLKEVTAVRFNVTEYKRLGQIRADMKRRNYV